MGMKQNIHFTVCPQGWRQHDWYYRGSGDRNIVTDIIVSNFNDKKDLFIAEYEDC